MPNKPNIELDAALVLAAMQGGATGFMGAAMRLGFKTTKAAENRAAWLKRQPDEYITAVSDRAAVLESGSA